MMLRFLLGTCAVVSAVAAAAGAAQINPDGETAGQPQSPCSIMERFSHLLPQETELRGGCPLDGACDDPAVRDAAVPTPETPIKTIRLVLHVFCNNQGGACNATQQQIDEQVAGLNLNYAPWRIQFVAETLYHSDPRYRVLNGDEEFGMKTTYADAPDRKLNIFITDTGGASWGYFPFWPDAQAAMGGIVLHTGHILPGGTLLSHEVGHNLGLWHTHHGVSEVELCSVCYERPTTGDRDNTGDRCSDTPATPVNFNCSILGGQDSCSGQSWGINQAIHNYMSYSTPACLTEFTPQQGGRMQCWIDAVLTTWLVTETGCLGDLNSNGVVDAEDLAEVVSSYGAGGENLPGDLDDDGQVGLTDLATILGLYGSACE